MDRLALIGAALLAAPLVALAQAAPPLEMVVQDGHTQELIAIVYSPDGKLIATASADATIGLWTADGRLLRKIRHPDVKNFSFHDLAFTPDGKQLLSVGWSTHAIQVWDLDGKALRTVGDDQRLDFIAVSPRGDRWAVGGNKALSIWTPDGTRVAALIPSGSEEPEFRGASFSRDGKTLAVTVGERIQSAGHVELYSADGKLLAKFPEKKGRWVKLTRAAFSPDGKTVFVGVTFGKNSSSGAWVGVEAYNLKGRKLWARKGHDLDLGANGLAVSRDGKLVATASWEGSLQLYGPKGAPLRKLRGPTEKECGAPICARFNAVAFSPDGLTLTVASGDQNARQWDVATGQPLRLLGHVGAQHPKPFAARFSPDGKALLVSYGPFAVLWGMDGHARFIPGLLSARFSHDGKLIVGKGSDGQLWVMQSSDLALVRKFPFKGSQFALSPDGALVAALTEWKNVYDDVRDYSLWNIDGTLLKSIENVKDLGGGLVFSPDGKRVFTDKTSFAPDGSAVAAHKNIGWNLAFSPDGRCLVGSKGMMSIGTAKGCQEAEWAETSPSFSADGRWLVTLHDPGGNGNETAAWLFETARALDGYVLKPAKSFSRPGVRIGGFPGLSPDGKFLAACFDDGTVRLINVGTGASIALLAEGEKWLVYGDDGSFDGSRDSGQLLAMVGGLSAYGIDQFALRYNRPDLILQKAGIADAGLIDASLIDHYREQHQLRLRRAGFTDEQLSAELHVPTASIVSSEREGKTLSLRVAFADDRFALKTYNIYVNDVPLFGAMGKPASGSSLQLEEKIELTEGDNKVEVACVNDKGAESYRALASATYTNKATSDLWVLALGVSKYRAESLSLRWAAKDAQDLAAALGKLQGAGFARVHARTLVDEQVTRESLRAARDFTKDARPDDTFVLFIAGHGVHDVDKAATYYFLTSEAEVNNLAATAARFEEVEELLQGIAPRRKLFLMDTCESGEADESVEVRAGAAAGSRGLASRGIKLAGAKEAAAPLKGARRAYLLQRDRFVYNDLIRRSGAIVFSSSRGGELSYESDELQNGIYTRELLAALASTKTDADGDGLISVEELRAAVSKGVAARTGGLQNPVIDRDNLFQKIGFPAPR